LLDTYIVHLEAGDLNGFMTIWTDDIIWMPPNEAIRKGKESCKQWIQPFFDNYTLKEKVTFEELEVSGDWAFARGTWDLEGTPKGEGAKIHDVGKLIFIFERQSDGSWKISHDIWNSDNPLPVGEPTT
jgi:ketosteroid isomerase-like protein